MKLDEFEKRLEDAMNMGDHAKAADLKYGAIPEQQQRIKMLEERKVQAEAALNAAGGDTGTSMVTDIVTADHINEIVARWTGIPVTRLKTTEKDKLINMERVLGKTVVGQREAVQSVANAIRLQRSGLANPNQPPSFLFCGPSGTGKTLLTKALAEFLFDDPKAMIRFDMSEYQERHALSRMIGAPPGYVGHDAGGQLRKLSAADLSPSFCLTRLRRLQRRFSPFYCSSWTTDASQTAKAELSMPRTALWS